MDASRDFVLMARYRKKPIVIEAEQYSAYGCLAKGMCNSQSCCVVGNNQPHVHTIHNGQMVLLEVKDWIIPEPDGIHFYPCKPDIFEATYEKVDTPAATFPPMVAFINCVGSSGSPGMGVPKNSSRSSPSI